MNLTDRDRKTLMFGGIAVIVILLGAKVFSPMLSSWSDARDTLARHEAYMDTLGIRAESQENLNRRKAVLAMRIGALDVLQEKKSEEEGASGETSPPVPPKPAEKDGTASNDSTPVKSPEEEGASATTPPPASPKPAEKDTAVSKDSAPEKSPVPSIEASSLATYVEKNAKTAGIKIKRITPQKNSTGRKKTKFFTPVTLQFSFECKIKNLITLLNDFENGEQFIRIDQMQISRDAKKGDMLTISMELSSYEAQETL